MKYIIDIESDEILRKTDCTISDFTKLAIRKQIYKENIIVICTTRTRYDFLSTHSSKLSK